MAFVLDCNARGPYRRITRNGKAVYAHRAAYEDEYGEIGEGRKVHHLCQNEACTVPDHLVTATPKEHHTIFHRLPRKAACPQGHALTPENRYPYGGCKTCSRAKAKAARQRKQEATCQ